MGIHNRFIPFSYVASVTNLKSKLWYAGKMSRRDAEKKLMQPGNENGAFLIRSSENSKQCPFALSLRKDDRVNHYRICSVYEGFFIECCVIFPSLDDLVQHYLKHVIPLGVQLGKSCAQEEEKPQTVGLSYNTEAMWEIPKSAIKLKKKIGQGKFGDVYEGLWNKTTPIAIKTLKVATMDPKTFHAEVQAMKKLSHYKLIQLYGVCTEDEPFYIVTELMRNGSLRDYLQGKGRNLKQAQLIDICIQVARGMAYLESQNYIHRDLAARNILVGLNNNIRIADFGLARLVSEDVYRANNGYDCPIKWTAPEAAIYNCFSIKTDVWSFGILMTEVITYGKVPYPAVSNAEVLDKVERGYRMTCPNNCPRKLYDIMLECWKQDPSRRPTFEMLERMLNDLFYTGDLEYF